MSSLFCLVCVSSLCLLVALVGRSWCLVPPGCCPGVSPVFRGCFSVTSEEDLSIRLPRATDPRTGKSWSGTPAAAKRDGCFTASVLCIHYSCPRRFRSTLRRRGAPFAAVAAAARHFPSVYHFLREQFYYSRCRLCPGLHSSDGDSSIKTVPLSFRTAKRRRLTLSSARLVSTPCPSRHSRLEELFTVGETSTDAASLLTYRRKSRLASTMSTSDRNSSMSKCRHCTFPYCATLTVFAEEHADCIVVKLEGLFTPARTRSTSCRNSSMNK